MTEKNQVKWVGVLPIQPIQNLQVSLGKFETSVAGETRTQICKDGTADEGTGIIHTVTGFKTFYLTSCFIHEHDTAATTCELQVRNVSDVKVCTLLGVGSPVNLQSSLSQAFPMPIAIPAGYDVIIVTTGGEGHASVQGWEE